MKAWLKSAVTIVALLTPLAIFAPIAANASTTAASTGALAATGNSRAAVSDTIESAAADPVTISQFTQPFTIRKAVAPDVTEICAGYVTIGKSRAFPGYIQGRAWVQGCAPYPDVTCAQTADIQLQNPFDGDWVADGDGPTVHGCAGEADSSIRTNSCGKTDSPVSYRTQGIFVVIDSNGDKLAWSGDSEHLTVTRIC